MSALRGKILWGLVLLGYLIVSVTLWTRASGSPFYYFLYPLSLAWFPIIIILHAFWKIGYARGAVFLLLAISVGFCFEWLGLQYGVPFGGDYEYTAGQFTISIVPVEVMAYWGVYIYLGYSLVNSILENAGLSKPYITGGVKHLIFLCLLIILDGLLVTAIDIFMDPIQVDAGFWRWNSGGPYFGVPLGNFSGWFAATILTTSIFRVFEFLKPANYDKVSAKAELIPTVAYLSNMFLFSIYAAFKGMDTLVMIGLFVMLPVSLISLILFLGTEIFQRSYKYEE